MKVINLWYTSEEGPACFGRSLCWDSAHLHCWVTYVLRTV